MDDLDTREPAAAFDAHDSPLTIWLRCVDAHYLALDPQYLRLFGRVYDIDELASGVATIVVDLVSLSRGKEPQ